MRVKPKETYLSILHKPTRILSQEVPAIVKSFISSSMFVKVKKGEERKEKMQFGEKIV